MYGLRKNAGAIFLRRTREHMTKKTYRAQWLMLILTGIVAFLSFAYIDLLSTQRHGICFWDSLFSGHILDFYKDCELVYTGNAHYHVEMSAHYDMTLYLIFAVWNLPCYLYEKITGLNAQELTAFILWGKTLVLAAYLLVVRETVLIRRLLCPGPEGDGKIALVTASSALLMIYSVGTGNYDVISLIFMLSGTRYFMMEHRKKAVLHFALAFSMKYFAVWCFVPILLLYEKKILKLFEAMLGLVGISLAEKVIFMSSVYLHREDTVAGNILNGMIGTLLGSSAIQIPGIGSVSLLIPIYLIFLLWVYLRKVDEKEKNREALRYGFWSWGIFFLLAEYSQYWIVFLIPFMVLSLSEAVPAWKYRFPKLAALPWILEGVFSALTLFRSAMEYEWVFLTDSATYLLPYGLAKVLNREPVWGHSFGGTLKHLNTDHPYVMTVMNILIFATLILLILICFLGERKNTGAETEEGKEWIGRSTLCFRTVFELILVLIPFLYYLAMLIAT